MTNEHICAWCDGTDVSQTSMTRCVRDDDGADEGYGPGAGTDLYGVKHSVDCVPGHCTSGCGEPGTVCIWCDRLVRDADLFIDTVRDEDYHLVCWHQAQTARADGVDVVRRWSDVVQSDDLDHRPGGPWTPG